MMIYHYRHSVYSVYTNLSNLEISNLCKNQQLELLINLVTCSINCSVDATHSNRAGRLINHSTQGNCRVEVVPDSEGKPTLCLFAKKDVDKGVQVLYDFNIESSIILHVASFS